LTKDAYKRSPSSETLQAALGYYRSGQSPVAEEMYRKVLMDDPENVLALHMLGIITNESGRYAESAAFLGRAIQVKNNDPLLFFTLGLTLQRWGKLDEAVLEYKKAISFNPDYLDAYLHMAEVYSNQERFDEAIEMYKRAISIKPDSINAHFGLGNTYKMQGKLDEAIARYNKVITLKPDLAEAYNHLGLVLDDQGKYDEAVEIYKRAISIKPDFTNAHLNLGKIYLAQNRLDEAETHYRQAIFFKNDSTNAYLGLGHVLKRRGDLDAALTEYNKALALKPDNINILELVVSLLRHLCLWENIEILERHILDTSRQKKNYTILLHFLGRVKTYQDRLDLIQYHRECGDEIEKQVALTPIRRTPVPARSKIRIGFMSSDLRDHAVSYFSLPLLENFDRNRFEVYCYSFCTGEEDAVQKKITSDVTAFRWWPHRQNFDVAQGIADDQVDILFELGGLTHMNKAQVMAYRVAPVQASWLGYPHSIGFSSIDYIFVDPFVKPEDPRLLIERPFELPETWITLGHLRFNDNPPINPEIPQNRNGGILTFGTMNSPYKYTPELIAAWAEVLIQVPNSRFLFVRPEAKVPAFRVNMAKEFARHGIPEHRLVYMAVEGGNMPYYNEIDIALDTFPQVGGTTTAETVWMGVPVVTLVGPALFERLSYSILNNAGLGDLCAFTREEYIAKAVALAEDRKRREMLRTGLRAQIRSNPLGQTERFAENFYKKIESVLK